MQYDSLTSFLKSGSAALAKGPVALIFAEDPVEVESTLRHHLKLGFKSVVAFMPASFDLAPDLSERIHRVQLTCVPRSTVFETINTIIKAAPNIWLYYCFNAEYLFYPFCETRTVGEMLAFHSEERRNSMLSFVVDLYAQNLTMHPNGVSCDTAMLDGSNYYSETRTDAEHAPMDRQLNLSGGLRWRFEDRIPYARRRTDRIALFKTQRGLELRPDHTFNISEYNTYSCPWHHNLTAAVCSFRAAKALTGKAGPVSRIQSFEWRDSVPFRWSSDQLLDLGLIETGQWF